MKTVSRREMLGAVGLAAGAGLATAYGGQPAVEATATGPAAAEWRYASLVPAEVAAEAYRLMPEGGCMYAALKAILTAWSKQTGQRLDSFPFHMFRYGEGGVAGWGSLCGTLNAGAAIIGLFENDKKRRPHLIAELFSWYEQTELPAYRPSADSPPIAKSAAGSVLCHISLAQWCKASGAAVLSPPMKERCCRLTADVAAKTVELLNHVPAEAPAPPVADANAAKEPPRAIGKMKCATCHQTDQGPR